MGSMESVQDSNVQRVEIPGNFADKSPRLRPKTKSDYSKPETLINLLLNITEDTCTEGTRGCCQHDDEPLPHSLYDQLEDQKRSDNFCSGNLQRSGGLQKRDEGLKRSKTFNSESLQIPDELYSHSFSDSTHPPFESTRWINPVLQKGLQALILKISRLLKFAGNSPPVVILMAILIQTQVACAAVQVPINCMGGAVITSPDYPATYPQFQREKWHLTAPEGRMILLTFNDFSLGYLDDVQVIDPADAGNWQNYRGVENTFPPFLSTRNRLILRFTSNGNPPGNGFNISASCYELSATVGFCNQTDDVMNGSWDSNITWFGSIVHLTCDDGYRLNGSGTLQCVTDVSSYLPVWNGSIPSCEMIEGVSTGIVACLLACFIILLLIVCGVVFYCKKKGLCHMHNKSRETRNGHRRKRTTRKN